jgi:hypothetical protein
MADQRPRSSYESAWVPYTKVTGRTAVRVAIGDALKRRSEVPQRAPLALLMKVDALRAAEEQ